MQASAAEGLISKPAIANKIKKYLINIIFDKNKRQEKVVFKISRLFRMFAVILSKSII